MSQRHNARTPRQLGRIARVVIVLAATGCVNDIAAPLRSDGVRSAVSAATGHHHIRSWRGKSGRVFTVDEDENTLSDGKNPPRRLTQKQAAQISETFDSFDKVDAFLAEFNSTHRACAARAEQLARQGVHGTFAKVTAPLAGGSGLLTTASSVAIRETATQS